MIKHLFTAIFFIFISFAVVAQDFPSYGKVTPEELQMKECPFDKEASAVVLIDEAVSVHNDERNLITSRHIRIKILKESGIPYGNITIPFFRKDDFEFINNVEAMVVNLDNNGNPITQTLDRKAVYRKNVNDRIGEVTFAIPSVKAGSIIEYRFQSTMKHYGGLEDWYFQREIPVVFSKYVLYIPSGLEFTYQVFKSNELPVKVEPDARDGKIMFEMKNIPGLDDEPYMDARRDYIQRVIFQLSGYGNDRRKYMTSWDEVTKELMASPQLGSQLNKDLAGTEDFIKLAKEVSSPGQKMKLVLAYVRKNMQWNGYNSKFSTDGVKSAWAKKQGTSGDLNLILVNLLKAAALDAHPVLVSERYNGKINSEYPFVDQFNTVYAVVIVDGRKFYLDATDKITPPHIIPYNVLNTTGFILNRKVGGLVYITDESLQYRDFITVIANLTPDEKIKGQAFVSSLDYARIRRLERYYSDNTKYVDENFKRRPSISIDSFEVINQDIDSLALQHKFSFSTPLEGTGDYKFIPLNLFSGFERNPFISEKRFSDINFGFKRTVTVNTFVTIPDGYMPDVLPKSVQLINPDKSVVFVRETFNDSATSRIISRIKMDFKKSHYTAGEYDEIKEFYKKMFDLLNEQIVLKKKS